MKKELSRRDFLKGAAAGALGMAATSAFGGIVAAEPESGIYTPGTYSATTQGMGDVVVTMTFDASNITDVVVDVSNETAGIGAGLGEQFAQQILSAQSAQVDAVSGATVTSNAIISAAQACIDQAVGATITVAAETDSEDGDWLGAEPQIDEIAEVMDFDVVVVGAGLAGICAARAAAEEGASVAVIEKSASFNCRSGEYALLNGSLNRRWGREGIVDTDVVVDRLMRECTYRNKRMILKKWAEHGHEAMDWFLSAYPDLTICDSTREVVTQEQYDKGILVPLAWPQPEHYDYRNEEFPTFPSSMEFRSSRRDQQGFIVEAQLNDAISNGAQVYYGCFGTKLLKDDEGRVTGIIVRDAQNGNRYLQFNAASGVILATGDNSGDEKIMKHFCPEMQEKNIMNMGAMGMLGVDVEGKTISSGDGLRLGAWVGAKVQDYHAPMTHHMGSGMGVTPFLQINLRGERFMNESIPGQQLENQIELQPEHTSFQIYDSNWPDQIPYMPANHGGLCYIIPEDEDESNPNYTDRQYTKVSAKAESYLAKGDTLEELLTNLGFEGENLERALNSIERYNELAKAGSDDDFGKPAQRMFAIENAPFYATKWGTTSMLVCVGGLESDENCHTFTAGDPASPSRRQIPGLYVCGNVQGSRYAVEYPICFRGISHSLCVYYGYIAGKNCVAGA
ncbi:MAG: FAD-dependent oxidoreductase [Clostridia bacterium]|nr:FAD-dependent oxidoreductase [Clostridia bacterium]